MRNDWLNLMKIAPIIQCIPCALVQKCLPLEKVGGQNTGRPSTSKSRGNDPLSTHGSTARPWLYCL